MKIAVLIVAALCLLWCRVERTNGLMELSYFQRVILPMCYNRDDTNRRELPNGQLLPIPNTIEAFISLVEKIEDKKKWEMEELLRTLLVSFRYDDVVYDADENTFKNRNSGVNMAFTILKELLGNPSKSTTPLGQAYLTDDEKCAMYYMMSHTVNATTRNEEQSRLEILNQMRESGVVTLGSDTRHAFTLGKVLLGLLAGLRNGADGTANAGDIHVSILGNRATEQERLKDVKVNIVYAATFGDLISLAKEQASKEGGVLIPKLLQNGLWNEANCPIDYVLKAANTDPSLKVDTHTTYSSIRGAIDGFTLGKIIKDLTTKYKSLRLSQVLRAYYSSGEHTDGSLFQTWCNRQANYRQYSEELVQSAVPYDMLYSATNGGTLGKEDNLRNNIRALFSFIDTTMDAIVTSIFRENSECTKSTATRECETASDMLAIMDYKTSEVQRLLQAEIIGNLSSGMRVTFQGSSIGVYTNQKPIGGGLELDTILATSRVSGTGGCAAVYYETRQAAYENEAEVLRDLNRTLRVLEDETEKLPSTPAKVVLYFNYGSPNAEDRDLQYAIYQLHRDHPGARIIAFAARKESLRPFILSESEDIYTPTVITTEVIEKIRDRVCKVPAQLQYHECYQQTGSSERDNKFEGFITPNHIQYYAMYPKYFLKSYSIKLTFKALTGGIEVCFSRYYSEIFNQKEPEKRLCKDATAENIAEFWVKNPCHHYNVESCHPFYFYIKAKKPTSNTQESVCIDPRCKTLDQIPFEFTHEGISCNAGSFLYCSVSTVIYAVMASIAWFLSAASRS